MQQYHLPTSCQEAGINWFSGYIFELFFMLAPRRHDARDLYQQSAKHQSWVRSQELCVWIQCIRPVLAGSSDKPSNQGRCFCISLRDSCHATASHSIASGVGHFAASWVIATFKPVAILTDRLTHLYFVSFSAVFVCNSESWLRMVFVQKHLFTIYYLWKASKLRA